MAVAKGNVLGGPIIAHVSRSELWMPLEGEGKIPPNIVLRHPDCPTCSKPGVSEASFNALNEEAMAGWLACLEVSLVGAVCRYNNNSGLHTGYLSESAHANGPEALLLTPKDDACLTRERMPKVLGACVAHYFDAGNYMSSARCEY